MESTTDIRLRFSRGIHPGQVDSRHRRQYRGADVGERRAFYPLADIVRALIRCAALLLLAAAGVAQTDWVAYGNDPGAMRYSSLRQIHTGNVVQLNPAWTFRTGKPGSEAVPIVVDGVMYATAPDGVYALVPETGELLWKYEATPVALRGLAYWRGAGGLHSRVFVGSGQFLLALDAITRQAGARIWAGRAGRS